MGCEDAEISAGEGEDFLLEFPSLGFVGDCVRLEEPDSFTCRGPSKLTVTSTQLVGRVREGQVVDVVWSVAASRSDGLGCVLAGEARLAPLDG